jgi:hypothetical protein
MCSERNQKAGIQEIALLNMTVKLSPSGLSVCMCVFLIENKTNIFQQTSYPPAVAPYDFFLFLELKTALKKRDLMTLPRFKQNHGTDLLSFKRST